jgi:hypothetical protein
VISPPAVYGLATFPSPVTLDFSCEPVPIPAKTALKGRGSICQALIDISAALGRVGPDVRKRIILITDGDGQVSDTRIAAANALLRAGIVLDAIILANPPLGDKYKPEFGFLRSVCPICRFTGGSACIPKSKSDADRFVRRDEFVDLSVRKIEPGRQPPVVNADFDVVDIWGSVPRRIVAKHPFEQSERLVGGAAPKGFRARRIVKEFGLCRGVGLHVYECGGKFDYWRVFVAAHDVEMPGVTAGDIAAHDVIVVDGDSGNGKSIIRWDLAVTFPPDYPFIPPVFRFVAVPKGVAGVSELGLVSPAEDYHPKIRVAQLIIDIQGRLVKEEAAVRTALKVEGDRWTKGNFEKLMYEWPPGAGRPILGMKWIRMLNPENPELEHVGEFRPDTFKRDPVSQISTKRIRDGGIQTHGILIAKDEVTCFEGRG